MRTWEAPPEQTLAPRVCDGCSSARLYLVRLTAPPLAGVRLCPGCLARMDGALLNQRHPAGAEEPGEAPQAAPEARGAGL